jgi:hypothetical protein
MRGMHMSIGPNFGLRLDSHILRCTANGEFSIHAFKRSLMNLYVQAHWSLCLLISGCCNLQHHRPTMGESNEGG